LAGKILAANNGELIARLAEDGQGVALLPRFIVDDALARGAPKQILAEWDSGALADIVLSALRETADAHCEILGLLRKVRYPYAPAVKRRRLQSCFRVEGVLSGKRRANVTRI
jgi:DNA-binding transcriptional LysR family regulator